MLLADTNPFNLPWALDGGCTSVILGADGNIVLDIEAFLPEVKSNHQITAFLVSLANDYYKAKQLADPILEEVKAQSVDQILDTLVQ